MFKPPVNQSVTLTTDAVALNPQQQQLLRLNIDFLKLLRIAWPQPRWPSAQTDTLRQCSELAVQRMACCGFSLFSLALHQAELWQRIATRSTALVNTQRYNLYPTIELGDGHRRARTGFMECALFFAWHLAQQSPHSARLLLGISEDCAAVVASLELWQCRHLAQRHSALLSPRWPQHPYFWADLLRYGASGEPQHFKLACLLGSQLLAQDLEPSAILHLCKADFRRSVR